MSRIVLENVTKRFGDMVAVDNLSLEIEQGQFFSMLGPSGCGKTTTMRLIAGLEVPDEGRIWIADQLVFDAQDETFIAPGKRGLGMVFQSYALWPHMTVRENVLFGLRVRRVGKPDQDKRLARILERLQIAELAERYPNELSGGQQQRVALARELVTGAKVLLMDEPLSNLDAKLRVDMRVELKELHEETGTTIIYVTHDQLEALTLSSQMAIMERGVLQQYDTPFTVFSNPVNLFVAQFMGDTPINLVPCTVHGNGLRLGGACLPRPEMLEDYPAGASIILGARPEELILVAAQKITDPWALPAVVESVLPTGYSALVRIKLLGERPAPTSEETHLTVATDLRQRAFEAGDPCQVRFEEGSLHLFDPETKRRLKGPTVAA